MWLIVGLELLTFGIVFVMLALLRTSEPVLFWDAFFLSTGFHLMHVLVGLVLLSVVALRLGRADGPKIETVAAAALFWHLCDLAWFFLFPLLYVRA